MVLFYDDITPTPAPVTKKRKYTRRAIKVVIGIFILGSLSLYVLSTLGGNSNALRLGIQDYLTDTSGYLAEMDTLHEMSFFPTSRLSFQGLALYQPIKKEEPTPEKENAFPPQRSMSDYYAAGDRVASIGSINIAMKFWDMFLGRRRFVDFEVLNLDINPGIWLPAALKLSSLKVVPDASASAIIGSGSYGAHKLEARMGVVQKIGDLGKVSYVIAPQTPVTIKMGPLSLDGVLQSSGRKGETLEIKALVVGKTIVTGSLTLKKSGRKNMLKADLKVGRSQVLADLVITATEVTGTVTMPALDIDDVGAMRAAYAEVKNVLGLAAADGRVAFGSRDMNIDLKIEKLQRGENEWGMATAELLVKPYSLTFATITGLVSGGALKGDFTIDATGKDAVLKTEMHLRSWDYARLQAQATGQADTHVTLTATGKSFADLERTLTGEILTIAGQGELTAGSVLYWGNGLVNTMLPAIGGSDKLKMNCMVADFTVKGDRADAKTLFMDLSDLTVMGAGSVNLSEMILDLEFKPEPKDLSLLDGGVAVNVTGPITVPKIQPDRFSLGKKVGGLPLGVVNPADLAFSLADLGLSDAHPCRAYVAKP